MDGLDLLVIFLFIIILLGVGFNALLDKLFDGHEYTERDRHIFPPSKPRRDYTKSMTLREALSKQASLFTADDNPDNEER